MHVRFIEPDLRRLDVLRGEALCAGLFEDEAPPAGVLGLVDWRLAGRLSTAIASGRLRGVRGEVALLPVGQAFPFDKLFVLGLGPRERFDEGARDEAMDSLLRVLSRAGVRSVAVAIPGRSVAQEGLEAAVERFAELLLSRGEPDEVVIIERTEAHRRLEGALARAHRRFGADASLTERRRKH